MNMKALLFILCAGAATLGYTYWPSENPVSRYHMQPIEADARIVSELNQAMDIIRRCCEENDLAQLETAFIHTAAEREITIAEGGRDPVDSGIGILREHRDRIDWSGCKVIAYKQDPNCYEVTSGSKSADTTLKFTFRIRDDVYFLSSIEKL